MADQFLVVSTGRCGSTLMSNLMNMHDKVLSLSEFFTMVGPGILRLSDMDGHATWETMCRVSQHSKDLMRLATIPEILADVSGGEPYPEPLELITIPHLAKSVRPWVREAFEQATTRLPLAPVHQHFVDIFDGVREIYGRKVWVERSGATLDYLHLLLPCFPNAKLIHIYRDGPETAISMSRHPYFQLRAVHKLLAHPHPSVERMLEVGGKLMPGDYGHYWSDMMVKGLKALADDGRPVLHVSYEALLDQPGLWLHRIFKFMGLSDDNYPLDEARELMHKPRARWAGLPVEKQRSLDEACEPGTIALNRAIRA